MNIVYFLKKKKNILKNFNFYENYLINGEYIISPNMAYLKGYEFLTEDVNKFAKLLFFNKTYEVSSKEKIFDGKVLYHSSNEDIKIFSDTQILGFSSKKKYKIIKDYFNVPKVEIFENYYLEDIIRGEKLLVEEIMDNLLNIYLRHLFFSEKKININKFDGLDKEIFIKTHGDIHQKNVIKKEDNVYYIDYDSFDEYIFYYDYINLLFAPAINKDFTLLKNFLDGKYDNYFKELFDLFGKKFKDKGKITYLQTYLNNRMEVFDRNIKNYKKYKGILKCVV